MSKIMRVFYDNAGLPYKDSALSIHYPILEGGEFVGANNTTDIYFYTANLGDFYFVANCKLPNGALVDKLLVQGSDEFGDYFALSLDSELTENKGHLKVALKGYGGNVDIEEEQDGDTTIVVINGTPTIVATGIVDIAINYAPLVHYISSLTPSEYEQLLAAIGSKLDITKGIYVIADRTISATQFSEGQLVYSKADKLFYRVTSNAYVLEEVDIGSINVGDDTLANRLSTLAGDISDLQDDVDDLDTNKADKIGALPHIIIPANTKVHQFINTHSLDNSPFIFILNNVPYFSTMRISGSFEIERCDNGQTLSAYRWAGTFDNNQTFEEIIVDANLDNYEQVYNKVTSISSSSTDTQYPSAKAVQNALDLKADKIGPLPSLTAVTPSENVYNFLTTNNVNGKPIALNYLGETFLGKISTAGGTSVRFEFENLSSAARYYTNKLVSNITFQDIFGSESPYRHDFELEENKVTSISSSSTDTQYPSAKAVYDNLQNVREVAEGKCKTFVLSYDDDIATAKYIIQSVSQSTKFMVYNTSTKEFEDKTAELLNGDYDNVSADNYKFNSQNNSIGTSGALIFRSISGLTRKPEVPNPSFWFVRSFYGFVLNKEAKVGDVVYVLEQSVPDRWVSDVDVTTTFSPLEAKGDLSNYYTKTEVDSWFTDVTIDEE